MNSATRSVWHVSTSLSTRGGVATYVRQLRATPLWETWAVRHVVTHRDGTPLAKTLTFARAVPTFCWLLVWRRPALVHLHMSVRGSFLRKALLFWAARIAGVPVVIHMHGSHFDDFHDGSPRAVQSLIRRTLTEAASVVALGDQWARRLRAMAPRATVVSIPNAVPLRPPSAGPVDGEPLTAVFLGEIGARKGAFTLLDAWARLVDDPRRRGRVRLVMAGDREVARARDSVDRAGLTDSVEVRSWLTPTEVDELLGSAQLLVLPSTHEGQPMAVLEAMAHGLCVVASHVGGIPEMIEDGTEGLLVPPSDVGALVAALGKVLDDPDLRARLGAAAHARVRRQFDIEVVSQRVDTLYRDVLGTPRPTAGL